MNIANEIVTFKTAFLLSGPVQYIGAKGSKTDNNKLVDLNRWMSDEDKQSKDKEIVDWMHIAGLGVRMVLPDPGAEQAEALPAFIPLTRVKRLSSTTAAIPKSQWQVC